MVGTRRTNACETCRRRRVKCDEVRPVCGQCAIKGRACTDSPARKLIWVKDKQLSCDEPTHAVSGDNTPVTTANKAMCLVKITSIPGGSLIHKHRLDAIPSPESTASRLAKLSLTRAPKANAVDRLRTGFVTAYKKSTPGFCLSGYSHHLSDIPRYLGNSKALDEALACLVRTHTLRIRGETWGKAQNALYLRALRSLQDALDSPTEARRSTTMCAITFLSWVEILGEASMTCAYVQHVGGLAALIRHLGTSCAKDDLARMVSLSATGGIIMDAIIKNEPCFLNEPQWSWILHDKAGYETLETTFTHVMLHFSHLASLIVEVRSVSGQSNSNSLVLELLERASELRDAIRTTKDAIDTFLVEDHLQTELDGPNLEGSSIYSIYWFGDSFAARAANQCWALLIHINSILMRLDSLITAEDRSAHMDTLKADWELESTVLGKQILMSTTYVAQFAPVGSIYMRYPMYMAWGTISEDTKEWAAEEIHKLNGGLIAEYHMPPVLDWLNRWLCGWEMLPAIP
ncbi:hypothetical protein FDECE_849 [Fusarium decemcellulare]|nr:hypothetical protein FDECE_849 [Fusarium decemcellulare]